MGPSIRRRPNRRTHRPQTATTRHSTLRSLLHYQNDIRSQDNLLAEQERRHRKKTTKVKDCTACLASVKNLNYQLPEKHYEKLLVEKLSEPGQEIQIDITEKLHNKNLSGGTQILIAEDRFNKWPTAKICKISGTKEVANFLSSNFNGILATKTSDKGGTIFLKEYRQFCKHRNKEIEYCTCRMHTGIGVVERAIQTIKNQIIAIMEDGLCITESVNRALRVMRFTIHTGLKIKPFELPHGRKPETELTNVVKDGKTYLSNWSEKTVSDPDRPKIPIYVGRDAKDEIINHIVMAKTKNEEKQMGENIKSPKKKNSVRYPFSFVEKNYNKKSLKGRFQNKIQTAIGGTESTVKMDTVKLINRYVISGPLFQTEKKKRREPAIIINGEINPINRHCLRGLDGNYGRWDEILRDMLNGKLKIVQNRK